MICWRMLLCLFGIHRWFEGPGIYGSGYGCTRCGTRAYPDQMWFWQGWIVRPDTPENWSLFRDAENTYQND